jgi:hypothetical protein
MKRLFFNAFVSGLYGDSEADYSVYLARACRSPATTC